MMQIIDTILCLFGRHPKKYLKLQLRGDHELWTCMNCKSGGINW